jgi:hypothetical protein
MKRFITVIDNRIIGDRYYTEIVDGEIEDDGTYGEVGMVLLDGVWQKDPVEIAEQIKQNRIAELEIIIDQKVRLGDDVQELRSEYRALLGL